MKNAGYSNKPLFEKQDYKEGEFVQCINAPKNFIYLESHGILTEPSESPEWLHVFCHQLSDLKEFLAGTGFSLVKFGFWVSWPKMSSGIQTDITEQSLRDAILPLGWVDTKVCAIDETWSGLKFVKRKN